MRFDSLCRIYLKQILIKRIKQMAVTIAEVLMIVISIGCIVTIVKHLITDK